ncbi:MAG: hypothetical protein RMI49_01840 [Candidatus Caldarchaeum sp.]|nr:hypothetical protein [Candidatus Caldarchaeum sp.]
MPELLPLITFSVIIAFSLASLYALHGRRIFSSNILQPVNLPVFYVFLVVMSQASAMGSFAEFLAAALLASSLLMPVFNFLQVNRVQPNASSRFLKLAYLLLLFAAIFNTVQNTEIHPVILLVFAASTIVSLKVKKNMIPVVALALVGLFLATTLPMQIFPQELLPIALPSILFALAFSGRDVFNGLGDFMRPVFIGALLFFFISVVTSSLVEIEPRQELSLSVETFLLIPVVSSAMLLTGQPTGAGIFHILLFALAASLATAGQSLHQTVAFLLTPITGLPALSMSATVIQHLLQLLGLSALLSILGNIAKHYHPVLQNPPRTRRLPAQTIPVAAVLYAVASSVATDFSTLISAAGCIGLLMLSGMLAAWAKSKLLYIPAVGLLLLGFNISLANILPSIQEMANAFNPANVLKTPTIAIYTMALVAGVWFFVVQASSRRL